MSKYRSASRVSSPVISSAWRKLFGAMIQERREAIGRSVEEDRLHDIEWPGKCLFPTWP